jgi:rhamnosyltransferase
MNVFAIVVVYNPNLTKLIKNLISIRSQVFNLVIIDNSHEKINLNDIPIKIDYFYHNSNKNGIARAQNIGINFALNNNANFILLMDQDSKPDINMVSTLLTDFHKLLNNNINIAAIGPIPINSSNNLPYKPRFRNVISFDIDNNLFIANELISSGTLINASAFSKIGNFDEKLFIDGVDHEWCWRAIFNNFQLCQTKNTSILHTLGEGDKKILGVRIAISSPFRTYYQYRNYIYLFKKKHVPLYWKLNNLLKYTIKYFYYPIFVSYKYFYRINKGIIDGFKL